MTRSGEACVPLEALSMRQRKLVERHLPLVYLTLNRHPDLARLRRPGRDRQELLQEGCLALADAVRSHDPTRHGHFAAFAMARIRYAMSVYAHEQTHSIRVPFITQRRRKARRLGVNDDPGSGVPTPYFLSIDRPDRWTARRHAVLPPADHTVDESCGPSVGELLRERYDQARARVVSGMKHSPRCTPDLRELVDRCSQERWAIPEPEVRTSLGRLAAAHGCSINRVTHCEERFRRRVADELNADAAFAELRRLGRTHPDALQHRPAPSDLARLRSLPPASALDEQKARGAPRVAKP